MDRLTKRVIERSRFITRCQEEQLNVKSQIKT